jgi:MSHA biogenesis protein MshN
MSLINQMLQDLEQRSSGNMTGTGLQGVVRAAPDRNRIHPAWWLVVLLSVILLGVALWIWLRPAPVAPGNPQLTLKIAPDLATLPSPVAQAPLPMDIENQNPTGTTTANNADRRDTQISSDTKPGTAAQPDGNSMAQSGTQSSSPLAAMAEIPSPKIKQLTTSSAPSNASAVDDTKPVKPSKPGKELVQQQIQSNEDAKLTKQVKDLTPQQQAENAYRQAATLLQQGHSADAMSNLEQALKFDPSHAGARQMLVGMLLQSKRNEDAIQKAQEGLAIDPSQVGLTMILARVQVEQNDQKGALATLERGLPYANTNADYQAFYAAVLQREKRNKEAIDHYVVALAKSPENSVWWMGLGISLQAENRSQEAKEAFSRAKATNGLTPELVAFVNQKLSQLR